MTLFINVVVVVVPCTATADDATVAHVFRLVAIAVATSAAVTDVAAVTVESVTAETVGVGIGVSR